MEPFPSEPSGEVEPLQLFADPLHLGHSGAYVLMGVEKGCYLPWLEGIG